eukprot:jgi/Ulvmu1/3152/UM015_0192.1
MFSARDKGERLHNMFSKLERAQVDMDGNLKRGVMEEQAINAEIAASDKLHMKANNENMLVEEKMVAVLGDQTTSEKGSAGTAAHVQKKRKAIREKELKVVTMQNEVAKLTVDVLNTDAHNIQLDDTVALLDEELKEKANVVEKYQTEIQRRNDEIEKKTRSVDALNRRLEKLLGEMESEDTGPLEATINNLVRELQRKEVESKDLQRHWINLQTELVARQNENSELSEQHARLSSHFSILFQKKAALQKSLDCEMKEISSLEKQMNHANKDMTRLNSLISSNTELAAALEDKHFHLEHAVMAELKDQEAAAKQLGNCIEECTTNKKELLSEVLEAERQIMLWERKLQLDREMQELLDPTVGQDVLGAMKKEIHRMELRKADLLRVKEQLMKELERSVEKRDTISVKGRANAANSKKVGGKLMEKQLAQKCKELRQSIDNTDAECTAVDHRTEMLGKKRASLTEQMQNMSSSCIDLRQCHQQARTAVNQLLQDKLCKTLQTKSLSTAAMMMEKGQFSKDHGLQVEQGVVQAEHDKIVSLLHSFKDKFPDLEVDAQRIILHAEAVQLL